MLRQEWDPASSIRPDSFPFCLPCEPSFSLLFSSVGGSYNAPSPLLLFLLQPAQKHEKKGQLFISIRPPQAFQPPFCPILFSSFLTSRSLFLSHVSSSSSFTPMRTSTETQGHILRFLAPCPLPPSGNTPRGQSKNFNPAQCQRRSTTLTQYQIPPPSSLLPEGTEAM